MQDQRRLRYIADDALLPYDPAAFPSGAIDQNSTLCWNQQTKGKVDECTLARARGSNHRNPLTAGYTERQWPHRDEVAAGMAICNRVEIEMSRHVPNMVRQWTRVPVHRYRGLQPDRHRHLEPSNCCTPLQLLHY